MVKGVVVNSVQILLVEDDAPKRTHVERFLKLLDPTMTITVARSVNSALDELETHVPDLILLDMSLPTFDISDRESGGRPQVFGGAEILRHMTLAGINCPTVVITGYEAFPREAGKPVDLSFMRSELEREFPQLIRSILHYNSTYDEWKTELQKTLAELGILVGEGE